MWLKLIFYFLTAVLVNITQTSLISIDKETKFADENDLEDGKSSLVFVFDTTGSMYNDLKQLREGAEMILQTALEESDIIGDFVFVPFHDPVVGPATVTRDKQVFKTALELVSVYGGGDCPEKSLGGIQLALNVSEPQSFVYVFTDATAGDHRLVGKVLDAVQRKQSQVVFVLTGHCNDLDKPTYQVYKQIAAASSGQVFNLNKTSVHKVLDFVKSSIKGRTVNLESSVNPAGYNKTQNIPVDSSLGEVTVSVSGSKPQISVVDPSGVLLTGPPKLVTTLDLSEIMVVKVLQPEPGNWSITVGSEEDYSVKVVGLSNLTFNHGFSVQPPKDMAETSYRPLEGTYNHMLVRLSQDAPVTITHAEIVSLSGRTLFELPLQAAGDRVYIADAFIPPQDFFYIAINGRDETGQELRRIGATAVHAKLPDVPYISAPKKVHAHSHARVVLRCRVESLVPVTAMWSKEYARIQPTTSTLQTTTIEYVIEDMTEAHVGRYSCNAKNVAGTSRADTQLILLVDPPSVSIEPATVTLNPGEGANISCTVHSEALLLKFQFLRQTNHSIEVVEVSTEPTIDGIYTSNLTLEDVYIDDAGNYTCVATNRGGSANQTVEISIQSSPTAQILGSHELSVKKYENITIYCLVQHSDAISWSKNGSKIKTVAVNASYTDFLVVNVTGDEEVVCEAERGDLSASDSIQIAALLKPSVRVLGSKNIPVLNGTTIEVFCEVTARPSPRVVWYRGSEERFLNHTLTMLDSQTYRSALKLNSSEQNINGTYFCVGENSLGIHQDRVDIMVRRQMVLLEGFNDTSVQLYQSIKLSCNIDAHPSPVFTWYHNNTLLTTDENIQISEDNKSLLILKVEFEDLGKYSCFADNEYEKMAVNGSLNVVGLDAPILARDQPTRRVMKQGESTIFTCSVLKGNPEPTLKWQFRNIESSDFITLNYSNKGNPQLVIGNVTITNAGTYRCVAENVLGRDEFQIDLVVHYPPQFMSVDETQDVVTNLEVEVGETVTFSCHAVGSPLPIVSWNKNGRPLVYGKSMQIAELSLVIEKVTEYDSGLFTCEAKSPIGSVEKNFTLVVYQSPKITPPSVDLEQEFLEGQLVELPCESKGLPLPEVTWIHNGAEVSDDRKFIDEFGIRFIANLTDFGDYTCLAKNRYGNTSLSYSLFIWVPPFTEPPLEVRENVKTGHNRTLQCDVIGFPVPSIQWEFNNKMLKENTTEISFNNVGNLFITNSSSKHEGIYVCVAENIAGVVRKYFYLTVNEPPKISDDNYTYVATNMDSAVTISCKATGKPKPYIVWSKDNVYIDKDERYNVRSDGSLTIKSPTEDMSGNYTCMAKNSFGTSNKTVEVKIYTIPATNMQSEASHPIHTVLEHTSTSVDCPTLASRTGTVKWYKDAALISTGKLQINNISRDDQTTYACVVSNAVGSAYSAISLSVEWPPKFIDVEEEDEIENSYDTIDSKNATDLGNITNELNLDSKAKKSLDEINKTIGTMSKKHEALTDNKVTKTVDVWNKSDANRLTEDNKIGRIKMRTLENQIQVIKVVEGDDTYLDCSVDSKPIAKTKWLFNSIPMIFADKPKLPLINVRMQNSGAYKCVVGNKHGTVVKEFKVEVLEPPFISEFDFLEVMLMEGVNATLDCEVKGNPPPTVKWNFNNTKWKVDNTSLLATNVSVDSEGVFRCDATNAAGHAHIVYRVGVVSSATIEDIVLYRNNEGVSVTGTIEAELGSHIRIACKAKGKPTPTIQWLKNGKLLSENQPDISYADLTIDGVETSHAGLYACAVSNEGGNGEKIVRLEVIESPKIFRSLFQPEKGNTVSLEVLLGQAYYLHCHAYGNPVPEIYWFRDGLPLMLFDSSMVSTEYGEVIQVPRAEQAQSGNYTCVARNSVGNTSLVYLVDVLVPPPQPKESSRPVSTRAGRPLTLTCPVEGSPTPYVKWNKHPYVEIGEHTPRVKLSDDNVTLFIPVTQVSDSGNYSCIMTNKAGTTEVIFDVNVDKPPSIAGPLLASGVETHDVALRGSVVLKCEADGHPLPKISWLKDTHPLSDSATNINRVLGNSLLAIWRASTFDAGQYICVVENKAGSAHRRYNVRVRVAGKWSEWGAWSYCNVTCGLGHQLSARTCRYVGDSSLLIDKTTASDKFILDESACKGPANETRKCHMPPCEESVGWSVWSRWGACSASCGAGTQARTRRCRGSCRGDNVQIRKCPNLPKCEWKNDVTGNDVIDHNEEFNENNFYTPEAVFEMEPELVSSHFSPDVEESYTVGGPTGSKQPPVYFDVEVTTNLDGSEPGPCQLGYRYNITNGACEDIDECMYETNHCHSTQVCANVAGAYRCSCQPGLLALGAGQRCMDINECLQDISGCEYACVNVVGGYVCACPRHMRLARDKHTCYTVNSMASSFKKPYSYDSLDTGEYLSTSVEFPARYKHMKN